MLALAFLALAGTLTTGLAQNSVLFSDDFTRSGPNQIAPWTSVLEGQWVVWGKLPGFTLNKLQGFNQNEQAYAQAVFETNWVNYSVEAQVQFSQENTWGGGIGGRLDPSTGAHYQAWIYPEGSPIGPAILKLIKFSSWTNWSSIEMARVNLPGVHTNAHSLKLSFQDNSITVSYDGTAVASVMDNGFDNTPPLGSGGIIAQMWTDGDIMAVDNVVVTANQAPQVSALTRPSDGCVDLGCCGASGCPYEIDVSDDLQTWSPLTTVTAGTNGIFNFIDTDAPNHPNRFYRTKLAAH